MIHRREDFRAHFVYAEKVKHLPNAEIFWNNEVQNVVLNDAGRIEAVTVRNVKTGEEQFGRKLAEIGGFQAKARG